MFAGRILLGVLGAAGLLFAGLVLVYAVGSLFFDKDCGTVETGARALVFVVGLAAAAAFGGAGATAIRLATSADRRWLKFQWLWPLAVVLFAAWAFAWLVAYSC
jgi:hypothetical protein